MYRTTIMLPDELKNRAMNCAHKEGISMGELIREAIELKLSLTNRTADPFFADTNFYQCSASDLAEKHDEYLYGEAE